MALRSGLAAQLGFGAESTYGTGVTVSKFIEFSNESLEWSQERITADGIRASNRVARSDRFALGQKAVGGSLGFDWPSHDAGLFAKHCLGAVATTTPAGGTSTRDHTFTIADPYGLSLTVQVGRPDTAGTVDAFTYLGCKTQAIEWSNSAGGILAASVDLVGQDATTATALASPSYNAALEVLSFTGGSVTVGGSSVDVTDISVRVETALKSDRFKIASSSVMSEPIPNGLVAITGSITMEFAGNTAIYDRVVSGTPAALVANWDGSTIEGSLKYGLNISIPKIRFDSGTPNVSGPDVLTVSGSFVGLYDGSTEPISVRYRNNQTSV